MIEFHKARVLLDYLAPEVIICELIGLSYWMYNDYSDQLSFIGGQNIINAGVMKVNEYVHEMNDERGLVGPCLADITHKPRGVRGLEHRSTATLHDGIHFNTDMAIKILDRFIINML